MKWWRALQFAVVVTATLAFLTIFSVVLIGRAWSDPVRMVEVAITWPFAALLVSVAMYYLVIHPWWDALRRGVIVTEENLHFMGQTIPIASILRAEIVQLTGFPEYLTVEHRRKWFRGERAWTTPVGRWDTESLERLRDAVRAAVGLPPQTSIRKSTGRAWRESRTAQTRGAP